MDQEPTPSAPGAPSDNTTLVAILEALAAEGFDHDMFVTPEVQLRCGACHQDTAPSDLVLDRMRRIEGASDPADMAAVLGITCGHCGARGTAVVRYGPEAEPQDDEIMLALDDQRFVGEGPDASGDS